ncbi:FAD binding domain-containing protein [Haliangium sp.]|uniref:FAD binding domain-containing protein n=1 Tax=Haliangium sp. TaxID=2663208 RepID=UPI003D0D23D7
MKPAPFLYFRPDSVEEAVALLGEHGDEAKVLAGGQSLVPAMNFRLAQPAALVDINRVTELAFIEPSAAGGLRVGATTRQRAVELSPLVAERAPLVAETMPWIAHVQIRNRGTFGGSVAHADPAAELPALMLALKARMRVRGPAGERWIEAADFFTGLLSTALEPDELLVEIELPPPPARSGHAFVELSRRRGDYAMVGVAAVVELSDKGLIAGARMTLLGVGEGPVEAAQAVSTLIGQAPGAKLFEAAAAAAAGADLGPDGPHGDVHASADYRRHLTRVLTTRALARACERAQGRAG